MAEKYVVEHLKSGAIIGYKTDPDAGGVVSDLDDHNVVGVLVRGVAHNEWVLQADKSWHTGKQYNGDSVLWAHRPSK